VYVCRLIFWRYLTIPSPSFIILAIANSFRLKEDSLGSPRRYLGAGFNVFTDSDGKECWAMSSDHSVRVVLDDVERDLEKEGKKLRGKACRPFQASFRLEVDISKELDDERVAKFQGYIMGLFGG